MSEKIHLDATIIGGGIIGLLTALELLKKYPHWEIAVLEASLYLGDHSSGRNSGVLHAGLYYPTNSMKHLLCVDGIELWKKDLCPKLDIHFRECGKVLFAKNKNEINGLEEIWRQARDNGVQCLSWLNDKKKHDLKSDVIATEAFLSPNTGILDVAGSISKIAAAFESRGGMIAKECKINSIQKKNHFHLKSNQYEIETEVLINAAGFFGPELRKQLSLLNLESVLVKGNYISTTQKLKHPHLYYPVPPKDLKGLGVHSTIDIEGKIKFGPNTEDISSVDYSDSGTSAKIMITEIMDTFVGLDESRLYWDYAGIRSKIRNTDTGRLETDFWIKSPIAGYIECLGIESPGLTSAPAIAKMICDTLI